MKTSALKKEMYLAIDNTKDNKILEAVYTILKRTVVEDETPSELSPAQINELDKRLADHKAKKLKYYTLDEVKKQSVKLLKNKYAAIYFYRNFGRKNDLQTCHVSIQGNSNNKYKKNK